MIAAAVRAGFAYWIAAFALGFVLGTVRTILIAPRIGETAAVAVELPIMLLASWFLCRAILRRWPLSASVAARAAMGATAFALLILSELLLAIALGGTAAGFRAGLATPAGSLGLAGQLLFALFPLAQRRPA